MDAGEKVVPEIKNQLTHLCCHHFHIKRLAEEVQKMENKRQTVQQAVDAALRNQESIRSDVKDWMERVDNWLITSHKILDKSGHDLQNNNKNKSCFLKWLPMVHYSLSVEAHKATNASLQLQITPPSKFDKVSNPSKSTDLVLESRALLEKQVMDALKDDAIYLIGLCGMGGVGKTVMAYKMMNWAKHSNMFEFIIFVAVSQHLDIYQVQKQIAEGLGLTLEEHPLYKRASKIYSRLMEANSFLIILDDVWERIDVAELGIPPKSNREKRKLIITSQIENTLTTSGNVGN